MNAEEHCEFDVYSPSPGPPATRRTTPDPSSGMSITSLHSEKKNSPISQAMERRLFHHYATTTSHTMPFCEEPVGLTMWSVNVPAVAYASESVYNGLLGITALHLLSLDPDVCPHQQPRLLRYTHLNMTNTTRRILPCEQQHSIISTKQ